MSRATAGDCGPDIRSTVEQLDTARRRTARETGEAYRGDRDMDAPIDSI
jgi:hypothetical protein